MSNSTESLAWRETQYAIAQYAERVASGEVVMPPEFLRRCGDLRKRGLSQAVVTNLGQAGSADMLRQVEALTNDEIRELNEAAA